MIPKNDNWMCHISVSLFFLFESRLFHVMRLMEARSISIVGVNVIHLRRFHFDTRMNWCYHHLIFGRKVLSWPFPVNSTKVQPISLRLFYASEWGQFNGPIIMAFN